jgi:hypothetical protein
MLILCLDPGTTKTGACVFDTERKIPVEFGGFKPSKIDNEVVLRLLTPHHEGGLLESFVERVVIEDITNQGVNGNTIIQTVRWTGRFDQRCSDNNTPFSYIKRNYVKKHLTGKVNGIKDSHIRQAVIAGIYPPYSRKNPGPLEGVVADVWSAVALGLTFTEAGAHE